MKRKLALLLCATLLLSAMLPIISASAMIGPQYVWSQNGKGVKLRTFPSKDSEVLIVIPYGTKLTNCTYYNGTWTHVVYNGYYGYMMTKFLKSEKPGPKPTSTPKPKPTAKPSPTPTNMFANMKKVDYYAVVDPSNGASFGNMRWAPSENQPVISIYYPGYQLRVLYSDGTWMQVLDETSGNCGFMRSFLLQPLSYGAVGTQAQ